MSDHVLHAAADRTSAARLLPGSRRGLITQRATPSREQRQFARVELDQPASGRVLWPPRLPGWTTGLRAWLRAAWRRHRSRRQIARLDAHTLKDIGVTYAEAEAEANKPFWR